VTGRLANIADGATKAVKVVVEADRDGTLRNRATVSGGTRDPNAANNSDTATTTVREETSRCDGGRPNIIKGTDGVDVLRGTPGNDVIYGYGGNDKIYGLDCNDSIIAGDGDDKGYGGNDNDSINGGSGNDRLYLKDGVRDAAKGGPGRDRCDADRGDAVTGCP
jgi:Ca2+-binding RTX toxin-like protein